MVYSFFKYGGRPLHGNTAEAIEIVAISQEVDTKGGSKDRGK